MQICKLIFDNSDLLVGGLKIIKIVMHFRAFCYNVKSCFFSCDLFSQTCVITVHFMQMYWEGFKV